MVRALQARLAERHHTPAAVIETHISLVIVCGPYAYKIKKALKTEFLDQSTLALRRRACDEELRLNRRLAADLYLNAVRITGDIEAPDIDGAAGPELDVAVKMRAFAQSGLWDRLAADQALRAAHLDELVDILVPFHESAAVAGRSDRFGSPAQVRAPVLESLDELDRLMDAVEDRSTLSELRAFEAAAFDRLGDVMAQRLAHGRVRECHGDLHLGNVTSIEGRTVVFDGIEFNDDLRWIDVISEVAFMAMDLHAHQLPALAHRFVNRYLEASGDYDGASVLRYYMVYRALVRAKIALLRAIQCAQRSEAGAPDVAEPARHRAAARGYVELAQRCSRGVGSGAGPALMITHGYSGSGKSTLTQGLVEASGAIRIRADVERKRLAGLDPLHRSGARSASDLYGPAMTAATYGRLRQLAAPVLGAGFHAILDATFLRRAERLQARQFAIEHGVPFVILDFEVNPDVLRQRLRRRNARGDDASDADDSVLDAQLRTSEPLQPDELGAVFRCGSMASAREADLQPDWTPLLTRLAAS
jgi:aminoglycoside phosphotransferase family enzyme/predicted kinase